MARFKHPRGKQAVVKQLKKKLTTKRSSSKSGETLSQSSGASGDGSHLSQNSSQNQSQSLESPLFTARKSIFSHSAGKSISDQDVEPPNSARKSISNQDLHTARKSISNQDVYVARKSISTANQSFEESSTDSDSDSDQFRNRTRNIFVGKILDGASTNEVDTSKGRATAEPRPGPSGVTKESLSGNTDETAPSKSKKAPVKILRKSGHMRPYVAPQATHRRKNGVLALQQIRYYQKHIGLLIPKTKFQRVVREVLREYTACDYRIQSNALLALQEACEIHLVQTFEKAQLCAIHAKRVTLMQPDFTLVKYFDN